LVDGHELLLQHQPPFDVRTCITARQYEIVAGQQASALTRREKVCTILLFLRPHAEAGLRWSTYTSQRHTYRRSAYERAPPRGNAKS